MVVAASCAFRVLSGLDRSRLGSEPPSNPIKVAAVDFVPAWGDLDGNVARLAEAVAQTAKQGVKYAVFPETAVSGYLFSDPAQIAPYLDTIPGKTTAALAPILARTGMYVSVGVAERDARTGSPTIQPVCSAPRGSSANIGRSA